MEAQQAHNLRAQGCTWTCLHPRGQRHDRDGERRLHPRCHPQRLLCSPSPGEPRSAVAMEEITAPRVLWRRPCSTFALDWRLGPITLRSARVAAVPELHPFVVRVPRLSSVWSFADRPPDCFWSGVAQTRLLWSAPRPGWTPVSFSSG